AAAVEDAPAAETPAPAAIIETKTPTAGITPAPAPAPEAVAKSAADAEAADADGATTANSAVAVVTDIDNDDGSDAAATEADDDAPAADDAGAARRRRQRQRRGRKLQEWDADDLCLSITGGSELDGPTLTLDRCAGKAWQTWDVTEGGGEIRSRVNGNCVTAGWPYLTATAARTPEGRVAVVALNEAGEATDFSVLLPREGKKLAASIPAHTMQTYMI
ncbi:unnamed protein product, partial [Phaeothamnion confervicola]